MFTKRVVTVFFLYILIFVLIPSIELKANSGPPSNVSVTLVNADFEYYFEILFYQQELLSQEQIDHALDSRYFNKDGFDMWDYYDYPMYYNMPEMLASFQDKDGFISHTLYGSYSLFDFFTPIDRQSPEVFAIWLNSPRIFKLILISENEEIIISELIEMTQYDFRVTWDLEGIAFQNEIQYNQGVITGLIINPLLRLSTYFDFIVRLCVTLMIELGILYLFGFRTKKSFAIAFVINSISQTILTVGTLFTFYLSRFNILAPIVFFVVGEIFVFSSEMIIYGFTLKEKPVYIRVIYAFIANLFSMIIGLILTIMIFRFISR